MQTVSPGQKKRLSRIRRRAIPAVREAYESGAISARRADIWLYLTSAEQEAKLAALLSERAAKAHAYRQAAGVIENYLQERQGTRCALDLQELGARIRAVLAAGGA